MCVIQLQPKSPTNHYEILGLRFLQLGETMYIQVVFSFNGGHSKQYCMIRRHECWAPIKNRVCAPSFKYNDVQKQLYKK